jgi:hypothetical protein
VATGVFQSGPRTDDCFGTNTPSGTPWSKRTGGRWREFAPALLSESPDGRYAPRSLIAV